MGMLDSQLKLATAQAATSVGDTVSTNIYDTGSANSSEIGLTGENLWIQAFVSTAATSGGSATLPGLKERVTEFTGFASQVVNPFDGMRIGSAVRESKLRREAPSYLTACGLAMRRFLQ